MNSKLLKFIVLMTIIAVLVWIAGEVVIIAVLKLGGVASIIWSIAALAGTLAISVWKSFKMENNKNDRNW